MTPTPHTIGAEQSLEQAHAVMREHRIRHLPVLHGGRLVGVISHRDLMLIESLPGVDAREVPVEDAMTTDLYTVTPTTPVAKVAGTMARRKLGSAIVMKKDVVIGVFTVTDACQALAELTTGAQKPGRI